MLCDAHVIPLRFLLSGGQDNDIDYAQPLLYEVSIPSLRKRYRWLLDDVPLPIFGTVEQPGQAGQGSR